MGADIVVHEAADLETRFARHFFWYAQCAMPGAQAANPGQSDQHEEKTAFRTQRGHKRGRRRKCAMVVFIHAADIVPSQMRERLGGQNALRHNAEPAIPSAVHVAPIAVFLPCGRLQKIQRLGCEGRHGFRPAVRNGVHGTGLAQRGQSGFSGYGAGR